MEAFDFKKLFMTHQLIGAINALIGWNLLKDDDISEFDSLRPVAKMKKKPSRV